MTPVRTGRFERDLKRLKRRGKDLDKLAALLRLLVQRKTLPAQYKDHSLKGRWAGCRDAHLEPDRVVIYLILGSELQLVRTGSHADLFK